MTNEQVTQKWDEIVGLFGPQAVLNELCCYMSRDDKQKFLEHLKQKFLEHLKQNWEVEL